MGYYGVLAALFSCASLAEMSVFKVFTVESNATSISCPVDSVMIGMGGWACYDGNNGPATPAQKPIIDSYINPKKITCPSGHLGLYDPQRYNFIICAKNCQANVYVDSNPENGNLIGGVDGSFYTYTPYKFYAKTTTLPTSAPCPTGSYKSQINTMTTVCLY